MNATPVLQVSAHLTASPSAATSSAEAGAAKESASGPTFAGVMHEAGARPARKSSPSKPSDAEQSGGALPVGGNHSPTAPAAVGLGVMANLAAATQPAAGASADDAAGEDVTLNALSSGTQSTSSQLAAADAATDAGAGSSSTAAFNHVLGLPSAGAAAGGATTSRAAASAEKTVVGAPNSGLLPISKAAVRESSGSAEASIATEANSFNGSDGTSARTSAAAASAATEQASDAAVVAASDGAATAAALAESKAAATAAVAGDSDAADSASDLSASGMAGASGAASLSSAGTALSQAAASVISPANAAALALSLGASIDKHPHAGADSSLGSNSTADAAAGLSQLSLNAPVSGSTEVAPTPTLQLHASVDSEDFSQGLSDRVSWMVNNGMNSAKLQVNPPQLGPIELNILVQGDHAQVSMTAHSAVTRDALESSSPQLRESLSAQGFGQVSVDISQRSFQDRSAYTPTYERAPSSDRASAATPAASTAATSTPRSALGALDAYA